MQVRAFEGLFKEKIHMFHKSGMWRKEGVIARQGNKFPWRDLRSINIISCLGPGGLGRQTAHLLTKQHGLPGPKIKTWCIGALTDPHLSCLEPDPPFEGPPNSTT